MADEFLSMLTAPYRMVPKEKEGTHYFRFTDRLVAHVDLDGELCGPGTQEVYLNSYPIKRKTPKGVILDVYGTDRRVLDHWTRKWACATLAEAKASFIARKKSQISILTKQLEDAKIALLVIDRRFPDENI